MKFIVAEKCGPHGVLLVVTDKNLIGKVVEERSVRLDLSSIFYKGEEKTEEEVCSLISGARDIHLTGRCALALGRELRLIDERCILRVRGIPHAEVIQSERG